MQLAPRCAASRHPEVKLRHLNDWCAARRDHAATYKRLVAEAGLSDQVRFQEVPEDVLPSTTRSCASPREGPGVEGIKDRGIGTAIYYPRALHQQEC